VTLRFSMVMSVLSIMSVRHKCKYTIISHGDERSVTFWLTRIPDFLSIKQWLGSYMMYVCSSTYWLAPHLPSLSPTAIPH
jgi:hypothetical protein